MVTCILVRPALGLQARLQSTADWQVLLVLRKLVKYNIEGNTGKLHLNSDNIGFYMRIIFLFAEQINSQEVRLRIALHTGLSWLKLQPQ